MKKSAITWFLTMLILVVGMIVEFIMFEFTKTLTTLESLQFTYDVIITFIVIIIQITLIKHIIKR